MRMWMLPCFILCDKHLLGEHNEIHKHINVFKKRVSITGRIKPIVLIEPESMKQRHDELVIEIIRRGMNHKSPYSQPNLNYLKYKERYAEVDLVYNLNDLIYRCSNCFERFSIFCNITYNYIPRS